MRTLPDNPNLDHLRRQAKDLLAGLRDTDPAASLADAQASLARQYGFRGWTGLKAEVDRMRESAEVADPSLARAVAQRYGLGEVTAPMRSLIRADHSGRPYWLETDRGRFAVRTMDDWIPIVDAETDVALQEAAAAAGVALPAPGCPSTASARGTRRGCRGCRGSTWRRGRGPRAPGGRTRWPAWCPSWRTSTASAPARRERHRCSATTRWGRRTYAWARVAT